MAVTGGGDAGKPRGIELERVEIMPLGGGGHGGCTLAGGEADYPAIGRRRQMRRQHEVGVRGGHRRLEDRAQEGASVGHWFRRTRRRSMSFRLSLHFAKKKTPASRPCGGKLNARQRLSRRRRRR